MSNSQQTPCPFHDGQFITLIRKNIRSEGNNKMCTKCFFDEENLQKKDVIIIDEFDTKIANLGSSLETIQHTSLQQLEILNDINQEKDRLGQAIVEMGQKKQSLDNFIKTSQSSFQLGSVNLSDNQVSDFMELFNQQELLRNINLELQRSLDPLRDLRTCLKQQREKILQDIQLINQILNGKLSIQSENQLQQIQFEEPKSYFSISVAQSMQTPTPAVKQSEYLNQNQQQQSDESFQKSKMQIIKNNIDSQQNEVNSNQVIMIILNFPQWNDTQNIEVNQSVTVGELIQHCKTEFSLQNNIEIHYNNKVLSEKSTFQELNIQSGQHMICQIN
ncbi:unnamed protein product [Paramecium octaurelia]|uniref:Ubiquitin-like domain-containing protein n=1 Tax=Paramecium octaurelia TaxID=43137 RepID=A0A8S1TJM3_PAROT|nr:unnamed protein product [Paramecium octaurelia]